MSFSWLKYYMPRSLYGRAALILILPILTLQLVVSVAFIRRHFEDVTVQMTDTMTRELQLIAGQAAEARTPSAAIAALSPFLETLRMRVSFPDDAAVPAQDLILWYDFTGRIIQDRLRKNLPETRAILLPDSRTVRLFFDTDLGPVEVGFDRRRLSAAAPHRLPLTMLFFGILMTVIAYIFLRNQLVPITRLAESAEAFGRGRTEPYTPRGATEVRIAGNAFLDMRARIERHLEQRTLMLSGVSHDLRTPLTRLKLGLSMLEEEEARPLLQDVNEMQQLLDTFLSFARDANEGETEDTDPVDLVGRIVADARRAGLPVKLGDVTGKGAVPMRPQAIRRAVENLINNAVRYGTKAEVSVSLSHTILRIRVEDDGPGIPAEQRSEAVKPFARLDPARNQNQGSGVGLGLAIVTDIARAHGGSLQLGSSARLGGLQADFVLAH